MREPLSLNGNERVYDYLDDLLPSARLLVMCGTFFDELHSQHSEDDYFRSDAVNSAPPLSFSFPTNFSAYRTVTARSGPKPMDSSIDPCTSTVSPVVI